MPVDYTKPIQTIDGDPAVIIREINATTYRYLIIFTDDAGDEETVLVNADGDSLTANCFIENVNPSDTIIPEDNSIPVVTEVVLPAFPAIRVRHRKRGSGTIVKVRSNDPNKSFGIKLDSGPVRNDGGILWALNKNISSIS